MTTRDRVLAILPEGIDAVILESPGVVSWYLGGARTTVPLGGASVVAVLVGRSGDQVRCHVMEVDRLMAEESIGDVTAVDWTQPLVPVGWRGDPRITSERRLEEQLRCARASLSGIEVDRYRTLGAEVAAQVTKAASLACPMDTERSISGVLAERLYSLGAEPMVLLVAGSARTTYRHPLPTSGPLGDRAMLVVGARRHGLIVNLTRWVHFAGPDSAAESRIREVEADVLDATRPGVRISSVFNALRASYVAHGFADDEWLQHHQGGPTGYFGRDPKVTPDTPGKVAQNQAFSWNPSALGVKVEDTVLATSEGIEILTLDAAWPSVQVAGRARPLAMRL